MKAAFLACSILLAAAPLTASAQSAPTMPMNGALVAANSMMTLYTFDKDTANAGTSACTGPCAALWPPFKASATDHAAAPYSVVKRDDGTMQWAYKGKPLYFFSKDEAKGDRKGDGFKDVWHVAAP